MPARSAMIEMMETIMAAIDWPGKPMPW